MSGLEIAFGIILLVFAVGIIAIVLLQEGQQRNPGVITGGSSDTFLSKHQGRSIDAFLARWTRFISVGFFVFVIVVNIILFFVPNANATLDLDDLNSAVTSSLESAPADSANSAAEPAVSETVSTPAENAPVSSAAEEPSSAAASTPASQPESSAPAASQAAE